jgi:hypothetical protein
MSTDNSNKGSLIMTTDKKLYDGTTKIILSNTINGSNKSKSKDDNRTFAEKISDTLIKEFPNT